MTEYFQYKKVEPTRANAAATQFMTMLDLDRMGITRPEDIADPGNPRLLRLQRRKFRSHPERYVGGFRGNTLLGLLKTNEWRSADELPFATPEEAIYLRQEMELGLHTLEGHPQGIFALTVADTLEDRERETLIGDLLQVAIGRAMLRHPDTAVNIPLTPSDPIVPIAVQRGFVPTERFAEVAGVPGVEQELYRRAAA